MQQINIKELVDKFSAGTCTEEELVILENWYLQWEPEDYDMDSAKLNAIMDSVWQAMPVKPKEKVVKLWPRIGIAAAVAVITLGVWLYYASSTHRHSGEGRNPGSAQYASDIAPGRNTATLTLASGKVINLDTNRTSVTVTDSIKAVMMLTASTPRGGQYQVVLPDGTRVWLNADSKIDFPSQFFGKERKIKLEGEGYFEVAHNKHKPFIVESRGQQVEVLGTHFNINSYADEGSVKTTLLEGAVRVSTVNQQMVTLKPNQQAEMRAGAAPTVTQVDPTYAVAWKNNKFIFEEEGIQQIMKRIERWYDVEVVYNGLPPEDRFGGSVSRFDKISKVLWTLERTGRVHFKIEGRKVFVSR